MHSTFEQLQTDALALATSFRPELLARADLEAIVVIAGRIAKAMTTVANLAAARLGEVSQSRTGQRQARQHLAAATGVGIGRAGARIDAARKISSCPEADAAARGGQLSDDQALLLSDAIADNPDCAGRLVDKARTASLRELADEVARARAEDRDQEQRRQAVRAARSLRSWTNSDGTWHMHAEGLPEDGARVMAAIRREVDTIFRDARAHGRHEKAEAYAFDGLAALAGGNGTKKGPRTDILVRVDLSALLRGYQVAGETCEIVGFGPVSAQAVVDMMDCGDPFLKAIVTKASDVVSVTHLGRRPNAFQASALDWLFPTCAAQGCPTRAEHLQSDHREDWSRTHVTVLHLLDRLCRFHHDLKTYEGWSLLPGRGKRPFVPPTDERHPGSPTTYPRRRPSGSAPPLNNKTTPGRRAGDPHPGVPDPVSPTTQPRGNRCPDPVSNMMSSALLTSNSKTSTSTAGPRSAPPPTA